MENRSQIIVGQESLGTQTPIRVVRMKGWLFQQSWLTKAPDTQLHPLRWTNNSKGQVWNPPPTYTHKWVKGYTVGDGDKRFCHY